jgi:hypothetical protein
MVIRFYTIRKLEGLDESPSRNFSFLQIPQIFAEFFNPKFLLIALPELFRLSLKPINPAANPNFLFSPVHVTISLHDCQTSLS